MLEVLPEFHFLASTQLCLHCLSVSFKCLQISGNSGLQKVTFYYRRFAQPAKYSSKYKKVYIFPKTKYLATKNKVVYTPFPALPLTYQ